MERKHNMQSREEILAYKRAYYRKNRGKLRAYYRKYYKEHCTRVKENMKRYLSIEKNRKRQNDRCKAYDDKHKKKLRDYRQLRYWLNRDEILAKGKLDREKKRAEKEDNLPSTRLIAELINNRKKKD